MTNAASHNAKIEYPIFSLLSIEKFVNQYFGLKVKAKELMSYADQNFYLKDDKGKEYVVKLTNQNVDIKHLTLQNATLAFLYDKMEGLSTQKVYQNLQGEKITQIEDEKGAVFYLRLLSWVKGEIWENILPNNLKLCEEIGGQLAKMSLALQDFVPPLSIQKDQKWDAAKVAWVYDELDSIENEDDRDIVRPFLIYYKEHILPNLADLRDGIIHNDANTHNIIVETEKGKAKVAALIDFGDMLESKVVVELAVCCAYLSMNYPNPLEIASHIVRGFHAIFPLNEAEMRAIFPVMMNRTIISVTYSAINHKNGVESDYVYTYEKAAWQMLKRMRFVSPNFAYFYFRNACGLTPNPNTAKIVDWLTDNANHFEKIILPDCRKSKNVVLDLSIGSKFLGTQTDFSDVKALSNTINQLIAKKKASFAIGKYNEYRPIYTSPIFEFEGNQGIEKRTLHIGIDIFAPAETTVFTPLEGEIYGFANNEGDKDYGPTIILKHQIVSQEGEDLCFYTLYGHLSEDSLEFLEKGMKLPKGAAVGQIGNYPINGNWPPHLHFQLMTDMLDKKSEFSGVALPSEADIWLDICPNPNLILQIPEQVNGKPLKKKAVEKAKKC